MILQLEKILDMPQPKRLEMDEAQNCLISEILLASLANQTQLQLYTPYNLTIFYNIKALWSQARYKVDGGAPMWVRLEQNEVSNPDQARELL